MPNLLIGSKMKTKKSSKYPEEGQEEFWNILITLKGSSKKETR